MTTLNMRVLPRYAATTILDGNTYKMRVHWNTYTDKWYLSLTGLNNDIVIHSTALLPGKNLIPSGYDELGELWVVDNSGAGENPTYDEMGSRFTVEYTPLQS